MGGCVRVGLIMSGGLVFQRSFEKHLFEDVASKIERLRIRSATEVEKFSALLTKAHDIYGEWEEEALNGN